MGLIVGTNKHWLFCIATTHFDWMGLKMLHLTNCYEREIIF